jgi:hypothetical protein
MMTPIEDTLTTKLVHFVMILLVVAYVVFVKKPSNVVESVSQPTEFVHTLLRNH